MAASRGRGLEAALLTVGLGAFIAIQSKVNGELAHWVGTGLFPAWVTMVTGFIILIVVVSARRAGRAGVTEVLGRARSGALPWWVFTGGLFGSFFLIGQSITVPLVGVAVFTVATIAGLTTGSLIVDRLGLTGTGARLITARRIVAAALAVLAVGIGVSDRLQTGSSSAAIALLALASGILIAPQQAFNGRVAVAAKDPLVGALGNFTGGFLAMSLTLGIALAAGLSLNDPGAAPWWAFLGGPLGLTVIVGAAWAVPLLGVLVFSLLSILGQLVGSLVLDLLAPTEGASLGWHIYAGVAMTFVAVLVAAGPHALRIRRAARP